MTPTEREEVDPALDMLPVAVAVFRGERFQYSNQRFQSIFGAFKRGLGLGDLLVDLGVREESLADTLTGLGAEQMMLTLRSGTRAPGVEQGLVVWASLATKILDGASQNVLVIRQDTARFDATKKDSVDRKRLFQAQQIANFGYWDWDLSTNSFDVSDNIPGLLEYSIDEFSKTYEHFISLVHPADRAKVRDGLDESVRDAVPCRMRHRLVGQNGAILDVSLAGFTSYDSTGAPLTMFGVIQDITELVRAQVQLRTSEQRLSEAYRLAGIGHWEWNLSDDSGFWSPEMFQLFDAAEAVSTDASALNDYYWSAVHPADRTMVREVIQSAVKSHTGYRVEHRIRREDGQIRTLRYIGEPEVDGSGTLLRLFGTAQDITDEKLNQSLLIRAKEAAESANQIKTDFLASVSHELRTPLSGILGLVDILKREEMSPRGEEFVGGVGRAARALQRMVEELLEFSKIEAGDFVLLSRPFDLLRLLDEVREIHVVDAERAQIDFEIKVVQGGVQYLSGDSHRIRQVLHNLVGNAIKFTDEGHVTVTVNARRHGEKCVVRATVKDTGIGIDLEDQRRVFQRFTRIDESMSRRRGGFGLGLSITQQIIERMGGTIGVSSVIHEGSEFWFELSLPEASLSAVRREELSGRQDELTQFSDERILVVEDDELCSTVAVEMLKAHGCHVDVAQNGVEALTLLEKSDYSLVFMDCQMPQMDGYQATEIQRKRERRGEHVPIVAMTAHALEKDRVRCLDAGMDAYLTKPIDREKIETTLKRFLQGQESQGSTRPAIAGGLARLEKDGSDVLDPATFGTAVKLIGITKAREILTFGTDSLIEEVAAAYEAGDHTKMAATAHQLIGRTRTLGAIRMSDICRAIVNAGRAGATDGLDYEMQLLREAYGDVLKALETQDTPAK